jgi:hypothetical protein
MKLEELARVSGKEMGELIRQEARILAVTLAKYTQPFGFDKRAQALGQSAVKRDFSRVYHSPDSPALLSLIRNIGRKNDDTAARFTRYIDSGSFSKAEGMLKKMRVGHIGVRPDPKYYAARWRTGTLHRGDSQVVLSQKKDQVKSQEMKIKMTRVGFAASGWATAADQIGGHRGIPAWKAKGRAPGRVVDATRDTEKPKLSLINEVNYTSQVLSESAKDHAIKDRLFRLEKRIDTELRLKLREVGK